jgi:RNA polymerase sigma-70 factor (ECF subfamily)
MQPIDGSGGLTSTTELIGRARAGDLRALDELFARLYSPLRRWTRGRLPGWARDLADTDDLVQEALVQTFKRIGEFEPRGAGALQGYVRQAILNRIRDELRRAGRRPAAGEFDGTEVDGGLSPLEQAIGREAIERYERSLERLKPRDRDAVVARIELGLDYNELAQLLGTPTVQAARKAAERALVRLAAEMKNDTDRSDSG